MSEFACSIIIPTYGASSWEALARERALPSAQAQDPFEILIGHDPTGTVSSVRNALAAKAEGEWLCFLDADDELASGYLDAMHRALRQERRGYGPPLLLTPAVSYLYKKKKQQAPFFWPEVPMREGNWLVIGTLVERELFLRVGGFEEASVYEDWILFARCWKEGAKIVKVPDAVYLAHHRAHSRNRIMNREERVREHYRIGQELFPEHYTPRWLERHLANARVR